MTDAEAWQTALRYAGIARGLARLASDQSGVSYDEIYQEALIGLHHGARKFDPEKGAIRSYCGRWARRYVQLYVWEHGAAVYRPWSLRERLCNGSKSVHRKPYDSPTVTVHMDAPTMEGDGRVSDRFGHDPTEQTDAGIEVRSALSRVEGKARAVVESRMLGMGWSEVAEATKLSRTTAQRAERAAFLAMGLSSLGAHPDPAANAVAEAVSRGVTTERAIRHEFEISIDSARLLLAHAVRVGAVCRGADGHFYVTG